MKQEPPVIDYASVGPGSSISPQKAFVTCVPGALALVIYVAHQYQDVPVIVGYLFWLLLALGVVVGMGCFVRFRCVYRARSRPWFVSFSLAAHILVLLVGVPFLLLLLVGAITGNLR